MLTENAGTLVKMVGNGVQWSEEVEKYLYSAYCTVRQPEWQTQYEGQASDTGFNAWLTGILVKTALQIHQQEEAKTAQLLLEKNGPQKG